MTEVFDLDAHEVAALLDELERDLVGLGPVKRRIRELAALIVVDRARRSLGIEAGPPALHMCFTGNSGTGKTTVAIRMAEILRRLGYLRRGGLVVATREDLVGQFVGHTAPKTREILKRATGGVLFIDEAYSLYRPENERDYGTEAIDVLLQYMEESRNDIEVILAGYRDRMNTFFESNPGMASRIAHHIDFPDYTENELVAVAEMMLDRLHYRFDPAARKAFEEYLALRKGQARFANARSVRNALDRARMRQASRLFARGGEVGREGLTTITEVDIRASSVFASGGS
jgi:probable Rubsico expression protein CbbX